MSTFNIFKNTAKKKTRKICEKLIFTITRKNEKHLNAKFVNRIEKGV